MIHKQDLLPWMRNTPYLWWAIGFTTLLVTTPVYIVVVLIEQRRHLWEALSDAWDLMTYNVKKEDETDD